MVEALPFVFLRKGLPPEPGGLEERKGPEHVRLRERERVLDAPVHMAFRRKVDNAVDTLFLHQPEHRVKITDVRLDEGVIGLVLDVLEVRQVAGVGQLVDIDDMIVRILRDEKPHDVRADEPGAAGDHYRSLIHSRK